MPTKYHIQRALDKYSIYSFVSYSIDLFKTDSENFGNHILYEVTWSFFNQSRKSSSPQNFINKSQVSTIINFSSAIKLKNTHIQS